MPINKRRDGNKIEKTLGPGTDEKYKVSSSEKKRRGEKQYIDCVYIYEGRDQLEDW